MRVAINQGAHVASHLRRIHYDSRYQLTDSLASANGFTYVVVTCTTADGALLHGAGAQVMNMIIVA